MRAITNHSAATANSGNKVSTSNHQQVIDILTETLNDKCLFISDATTRREDMHIGNIVCEYAQRNNLSPEEIGDILGAIYKNHSAARYARVIIYAVPNGTLNEHITIAGYCFSEGNEKYSFEILKIVIDHLCKNHHSATKIQKTFRGAISRKYDKDEMKLKARIIKYMELLTSYFICSSTALEANALKENRSLSIEEENQILEHRAFRESIKKSESQKTCLERHGISNKFAYDRRIGNCERMAIILLKMLKLDNKLPKDFLEQLTICRLDNPHDHLFLFSNNYAIDPWLGFINFKPVSGYRRYSINAKSTIGDTRIATTRTRGYLGDYTATLNF